MSHLEELKVRDLVTRTTEVLKRASAGSDDIGSRYSRLLELLWKQKSMAPTSPAGTHQSGDVLMQSNSALSHHLSDQSSYVHFSPANDFSWLDLEAVGDYVSGDQISGANTLALDTFQNPDIFQAGQERSQAWQVPWSGDMSSSLLF